MPFRESESFILSYQFVARELEVVNDGGEETRRLRGVWEGEARDESLMPDTYPQYSTITRHQS